MTRPAAALEPGESRWTFGPCPPGCIVAHKHNPPREPAILDAAREPAGAGLRERRIEMAARAMFAAEAGVCVECGWVGDHEAMEVDREALACLTLPLRRALYVETDPPHEPAPYGEFIDTNAINVPTLSTAMSTAYKSVGSWDDFDDTVLAFAKATAVEYARLASEPSAE